MKQYATEFKERIIARRLPPNNVRVPDPARETGVPKDTLYARRIKFQRANGDTQAKHAPSGKLSSEEKLAVVIETASLQEQ